MMAMKKLYSLLSASLFLLFTSCGTGPGQKAIDRQKEGIGLERPEVTIKKQAFQMPKLPKAKAEKIISILDQLKIIGPNLPEKVDKDSIKGLLIVGKDLDHWTRSLKEKLKAKGPGLKIGHYFENGRELI